MPTLVAGIVASLAGWLFEDLLSPLLGFGPTALVWLVGLRES